MEEERTTTETQNNTIVINQHRQHQNTIDQQSGGAIACKGVMILPDHGQTKSFGVHTIGELQQQNRELERSRALKLISC